MDSGIQGRLTPDVNKFEQQYGQTHVVTQPTTSGWTWLFLMWALSNSSPNSRTEADHQAMRSRISELERQLSQDAIQWQQLQHLSPTGEAQGNSAAEEGLDGKADSGPASNLGTIDSLQAGSAGESVDAIEEGLGLLIPLAGFGLALAIAVWIFFVQVPRRSPF